MYWYICKVKYGKLNAETGLVSDETETYMVNAINFTEAEKRLHIEVAPYNKGENFDVQDIRRTKVAEVFKSDKESDDRWYKLKRSFKEFTGEGKDAKEKEINEFVYVQAAELPLSLEYHDEKTKGVVVDYTIKSVVETPIMDVFDFAVITDNNTAHNS